MCMKLYINIARCIIPCNFLKPKCRKHAKVTIHCRLVFQTLSASPRLLPESPVSLFVFLHIDVLKETLLSTYSFKIINILIDTH